jgi:hypothetical protein
MPRRKLTLPDNWKDFLADVDAALSQRFRLRCWGGFVLAAIYELQRPTADIDYIEMMPRDQEPKLMDVAGPQSKLAKGTGCAYTELPFHSTPMVLIPT